jgi:cellulose synthase operon protein C
MTLRGARSLLFRALPWVLAGFLASCRHRQPPAPPALEVEYSGCWAFYLPNQVCVPFPDPDRRLNLWVRTTPEDMKVEIRAGSRLLPATGEEVSGGGKRYRPNIPKGADLLTVSVRLPDGSPGPNWSLRLGEPEMPAWLDEVPKLSSSDARKLLERLRKSAPRKEQSLVLKCLADFAQGDGKPREAEKFLLEAWSSDRAENRWSGEVEKASQLAWLYISQRRFSAAQETLKALRFPSNASAKEKLLVTYYSGLLAEEVGNYRLALEQLGKVDELAKRVRMTKYRVHNAQIQARVFQDLGRSQDASTLLDRLLANLRQDPYRPCDAGDLLTNVGWFRLIEHEAGKEAKNPTPLLEQAQAIFEKNQCSPSKRLNARLNLALAYQHEARWSAARQELARARELEPYSGLGERLWWDDLEARAAITEGHATRALGLYEELGKNAELAVSPEGRLRALLGRANAQLTLGQRKAAIDALAEADQEIEKQSRHIPVHQGRDTFFAYQEAATRLYLDLLLIDQQWQRAFDLARRARSRLLRQLAVRDRLSQLKPEEQQKWLGLLAGYRVLRDAVDREAARSWQLAVSEKRRAQEVEAARLAEARDSLDNALASLGDIGEGSLSPPRLDEVILAYHPLPKGRWAGFAATVRGITVKTFKLPPETATNEELSQILLKPFQAAIAASQYVRVLPYGPLRSVDFHALPFAGGEPLLASHLVVYSLDLPVRSSPALTGGRQMALVVSNPQGNLPAANEEAKVVADAIRTWGPDWRLEALQSRKARSEAVLRELPTTRLFHYAGHGVFAGFAGWDSELPLAGNSRLTLGDVLALQAAPAWIVLSACDAGRSSEEAPGEGIGLANAFLLAGSQAVVASPRRVSDLSAKDLMRELYRGWESGADLPSQLRRAQLSCRRKDPSVRAAWASFRSLVP